MQTKEMSQEKVEHSMDYPLVSIRCLVYNHEPYLRQCLDGFVIQRTSFPFEVIVHDDASTDGSAAIIREYAEKYPDIIKPVFETENQYSKHDGSLRRAIDSAVHLKSRYFAYCEGDDYWVDPNKLQLQVDFLESHSDYFMTCHGFKYYYEDTKEFEEQPFVGGGTLQEFNGRVYCTPTIDNYFKFSPWFTQLLTIVHRRQTYFSDEVRKHYKAAHDYIICYYMMRAGKCALFKDKMGVYRKQSNGVFSGTNATKWKELAFTQDIILYRLENEKRVIPNINYFMVELAKEYSKHFQFGKLLKLLLRYLTGIKPTHLCEAASSRIIKVFHRFSN